MKKRVISFLFLFALVLSVTSPAALGAQVGLDNFKTVRAYSVNKFSDVSTNSWFYENVKRAYELDLVDGREESAFVPYENITIAEAIKFAACLHSVYYTGTAAIENGNPWYRPYVDYALEYGIISSEYSDYGKQATRAQFAAIFANALPNDALKRINEVGSNAIPDVSPSASYASAVYKLYRAGILTGSDDNGAFIPDSNILRCEAAAIVTRMADESLREVFTLKKNTYTAEEIFENCAPSVFYIELYNASGTKTASGSGFFIDSSGTAVTNYHVIAGASSAKIRLSNGREYKVAGVYDYDEGLDLALIKIDGSNFAYLNIGDSTSLSNGATIYAIGSPLGLENSITQGVISSRNRVINGREYIQVSASISHGSSGGALINTAGQVIGVTSASIEGGQNLNLAVPIHKINSLTKDTCVALSTLAGSEKVVVSSSAASVTVARGAAQTIEITMNTSKFYSVIYQTNNKNVATGQWGEWTSNTSIPLTIYGIGRGSTTFIVTAVDSSSNELGRTAITVSVA